MILEVSFPFGFEVFQFSSVQDKVILCLKIIGSKYRSVIRFMRQIQLKVYVFMRFCSVQTHPHLCILWTIVSFHLEQSHHRKWFGIMRKSYLYVWAILNTSHASSRLHLIFRVEVKHKNVWAVGIQPMFQQIKAIILKIRSILMRSNLWLCWVNLTLFTKECSQISLVQNQ